MYSQDCYSSCRTRLLNYILAVWYFSFVLTESKVIRTVLLKKWKKKIEHKRLGRKEWQWKASYKITLSESDIASKNKTTGQQRIGFDMMTSYINSSINLVYIHIPENGSTNLTERKTNDFGCLLYVRHEYSSQLAQSEIQGGCLFLSLFTFL